MIQTRHSHNSGQRWFKQSNTMKRWGMNGSTRGKKYNGNPCVVCKSNGANVVLDGKQVCWQRDCRNEINEQIRKRWA